MRAIRSDDSEEARSRPQGWHGPHPYRSPAEGKPSRPDWWVGLRKIVLVTLGVLAVVAGIGYWIWSQGTERRALAALPASERQELFHRTVESLRFCQAHARQDSFREYCEQQASLAVSFPDCGGPCRALARMPWSGPHR